MTTTARASWTFASTGRLREPFVASRDAPESYPGYAVSFLELFLGPGRTAAELRRVILELPTRVLNANIIVVRDAPDGTTVAGELSGLAEDLATQLGEQPSIALLRQTDAEVGRRQLELSAIAGAPPRDPPFLLALRALELYGHLLRTGAIYEAQDAHYQLPSGVHAGSYIRVADAFDDPLISRRISDWLEDRIHDESILLADSWTLMPLLQELSARRTAGSRRHEVYAFPEYPSSELIRGVLELIAAQALSLTSPHVLFITSVVGTGHFLRRIKATAAELLEGVPFECIVLVSSQSVGLSDPVVLSLSDDAGGSGAGPTRAAIHLGETCTLCNDPERAAVILIDHRNTFRMSRSRTEMSC